MTFGQNRPIWPLKQNETWSHLHLDSRVMVYLLGFWHWIGPKFELLRITEWHCFDLKIITSHQMFGWVNDRLWFNSHEGTPTIPRFHLDLSSIGFNQDDHQDWSPYHFYSPKKKKLQSRIIRIVKEIKKSKGSSTNLALNLYRYITHYMVPTAIDEKRFTGKIERVISYSFQDTVECI